MKTIIIICLSAVYAFTFSQELNAQTKESIIEEAVIYESEEMPRFPGCEQLELSRAEKEACAQRKMLEYIYNNLKYPGKAREDGIEGQVVVQFIVNKKGRFENINVVRDLAGGCGDEVLRIVQEMSKMEEPWRPGYQDGEPVKVKYTLPVKFKLDGGNKTLWQRIFGG